MMPTCYQKVKIIPKVIIVCVCAVLPLVSQARPLQEREGLVISH